MLDGHAKPANTKSRYLPVTDVWMSMNMDRHMSARAVAMRKATQKMIESCEKDFEPYVHEATFPKFVISKIKALGINGLGLKDFGGPGLSLVESGAMCYELAKIDGSVTTFFTVHNAIGMVVIDKLGDEEQRARLLPEGISFDRLYSFGLTEPDNGSDASSLKTTATKVEGGYLLNGKKRWIGNGAAGSPIVWARNEADGNRV